MSSTVRCATEKLTVIDAISRKTRHLVQLPRLRFHSATTSSRNLCRPHGCVRRFAADSRQGQRMIFDILCSNYVALTEPNRARNFAVHFDATELLRGRPHSSSATNRLRRQGEGTKGPHPSGWTRYLPEAGADDSFAHLSACCINRSVASSPISGLAKKQNCVALNVRGSTTLMRSSSDRVRKSAIALSVSRSQKAYFMAEITRQTYRSSSGSAANAAKYGSISCPEICAFKRQDTASSFPSGQGPGRLLRNESR